jgi:membrane-associated phospholipid phosphatase
MYLKKTYAALTPVDLVSIVFLAFLALLNIAFFNRVPDAAAIIAVNTAVIAAIAALAHRAHSKPSAFITGVHRWYCYPFILFVFKEIYLMVRPIHPVDYDGFLAAADHWLFGVYPTQWMMQFAHPVLTEIFQISYFSYYILFLILGVELYKEHSVEEFDRAAFLIVYGFYLSYLGYFLLPAVGPRFTLHNFYTLDQELPGLLCTPWMRAIVNAGESISSTTPNALAVVQRDVFPSGHTELTLIVIYLSHRYRIKLRWLVTVFGSLLIVATVYLRYHYVVDLFGGAVFFLFAVWSGNIIQRWTGKDPHRSVQP